MKKILLLFIPLLLSTLFLSGCLKKKETQSTPKPKKKISKPVNQIPFEQRPYVQMIPTKSREIDVTVFSVPKTADSVEYLVEYQYGTSLGGNQNLIKLDTLPATKQFALYSRSAGGKTSYEEDVKGGTLLLKFQSDDEYWLKHEWNYFDRINPKSSTKNSQLVSRDGKFTVKESLKGAAYIIIYNSPGLPAEISGKINSAVYTLAYAGTPSDEEITVTIDASQGTIWGWDKDNWVQLDTTNNGKLEATDSIMDAYVVVK